MRVPRKSNQFILTENRNLDQQQHFNIIINTFLFFFLSLSGSPLLLSLLSEHIYILWFHAVSQMSWLPWLHKTLLIRLPRRSLSDPVLECRFHDFMTVDVISSFIQPLSGVSQVSAHIMHFACQSAGKSSVFINAEQLSSFRIRCEEHLCYLLPERLSHFIEHWFVIRREIGVQIFLCQKKNKQFNLP